jgi:predicted transcriptional regulator
MSRSDIGEYVGISLEAVSRAFRSLTARGIIKTRDRRHLRIVDRSAFEALVDEMAHHRPLNRPAGDK